MRGKPFLAGVIAAGMALVAAASADTSPEYAVKAAYLPKFITFISWPEGTFVSAAAPVSICLLGPDPFGGKLDEESGSLKAGDHPIVVRHLAEPDPQISCQLLFLGSGADPALVDAGLESVKGKPVVTVTDSGLNVHGVVSFVIIANHVDFDIDDAEAAQDGLTISSKLLGLAHAVRLRGRP
jgi:YfiR/HmsC-like